MSFDLAAHEDWHFWFVGRDELVLALLDRYAPRGAVVDVGCGTGAFASRIASRDAGRRDVLALDHEPPARADGVPAATADAERLPLRGGCADVVLARDVLEHLDDDVALAEVRRVLRPGGVLLALVPAWPRLWSARDVQAGHRRRYTRRRLRALVEGQGFEVLELRGYQAALLPAMALSRLLARARPEARLRGEETPRPAINAVLTRVNRLEAAMARSRSGWLRPPTGSTLAVVARPA